MAIQEWTILKLTGPASADAVFHCDHWWNQRRSDDLSCFSPDDWPASVRRAVTRYLSTLTQHRLEPPILYFSQHLDLWSVAGELESYLGNTAARILHDAGELRYYQLPDRGKLLRRCKARTLKAQFPETHWLAQRLIEAILAHDNLKSHVVILINRHSITTSPTDEQLQTLTSKMPKWLTHPAAK